MLHGTGERVRAVFAGQEAQHRLIIESQSIGRIVAQNLIDDHFRFARTRDNAGARLLQKTLTDRL